MSDVNPLRVLLVDDEGNMLSALKRMLRGEAYDVSTFNNPLQALEAIQAEEFDVIVSDMRMPEMSGADFLLEAATLWPDTPRILLTGYSDQDSTVRAINEAKIFRYVEKPWDNDELRLLINEAGENHRTVQRRRATRQNLLKKNLALKVKTKNLHDDLERNEAELAQAAMFVDLAQDELRHSYETFIKAFANIINLKIGNESQLSLRIQEHCNMVAKAMECSDAEEEAIRNAALLYQLGKIFLHDSMLRQAFCDLSEADQARFRQHAVLGEQALMPISALESCAKIIRHQNECVDGKGYPDGLKGPAIPLGSRILKVVIDFNQYLGGLITGKAETLQTTIKYMKQHVSSKYDPAVLKQYLSILEGGNAHLVFENEQFIKTSYLTQGMSVSRDLHNHDGILLLSKDTKLSEDLIKKLKLYEKRNQIELLVPVSTSKGVVETTLVQDASAAGQG
ncbi:MAG: HD domain-containing phosphohydrolase [Pseudomonadota bacterium]|nr:HD domain-containing phosphohydrolase [Pseudomonadota bacterium]